MAKKGKSVGFLPQAVAASMVYSNVKSAKAQTAAQHGRTQYDLEYERLNAEQKNKKSDRRWLIFLGLITLGGIAIGTKKLVANLSKSKEDKQELEPYKELINRKNVTLKDADLKTMSDAIFHAIDAYIDDETAIYNTLQRLKTQDDWYALIEKFGVKKETGLYPTFEGTIVDWMESKLSSGEKVKIKKILETKGITY